MPKGVYPHTHIKPKVYEAGLVTEVASLYAQGMTQAEVAEALGTTRKVVYRVMVNHRITRRRAAIRDQRGDRNANWKGSRASYQALHLRVYRERGEPSEYPCLDCGRQGQEWATMTYDYTDIEGFVPLCRSCHHRVDGTVRNLRGGDAHVAA